MTIYKYEDASNNNNFFNANGSKEVSVHLDDYKLTDQNDMTDDQNAKYLRVAVMLPLTGKYSEISQSILNGILVKLNSHRNKNIKVYIYDTYFSNDKLLIDVKRLNQKGVDMIIGPLFEQSLDIIRDNIVNKNIPIFYLGENLSKPSSNVYKFTFSSTQEVGTILQYIYDKQEQLRQDTQLDGKTIVAAIIPNTAYGDTVAKDLQNQADLRNIKIETIARYSEGDLNQAILKIQAVKDRISTLFISGEGDQLRSMIATIPFYGIDQEHIRFIGTSSLYTKWLPFEPVMLGSYTATPIGHDYRVASYYYNKMMQQEINQYAYIGYSLWKYVSTILNDYSHMKAKLAGTSQKFLVMEPVDMSKVQDDINNLNFDISDTTFTDVQQVENTDLQSFIRHHYMGKDTGDIILHYDGVIYRKMFIYQTVHKKLEVVDTQ